MLEKTTSTPFLTIWSNNCHFKREIKAKCCAKEQQKNWRDVKQNRVKFWKMVQYANRDPYFQKRPKLPHLKLTKFNILIILQGKNLSFGKLTGTQNLYL